MSKEAPRTEPERPSLLGYEPAFDGLRAVAVLAVMAYHFGLGLAGGGFLGVDVFFVLSGFLITSLLCEEEEVTGRIRLGHFYLRRALRLFPGLVLLLGVLQLFSLTFHFPYQVAELRRESLATLFYVSNWAMVVGTLPPLGLLTHTWSLAIEEQFYIVWPVVLRAALARWSHRAVLGLTAGLATASALLRWLLWQDPESFSRIYHASDTRAEALLLGAVVALALRWNVLPSSPTARRALSLLSGAAVAGLALMIALAELHDADLLRGGLTLVAVAVAVLVVDIRIRPSGLLGRALRAAPLVSIGRISYGLYLWHVPVLLVVTPVTLSASPPALAAARFAATFLAAGLSWFLVEKPFLRWKARFSPPRERA